MPRPPAQSRAYKDVTLGQLRSFCETARRGSLTAAASALKLAHPTVWKQVHALESTFGRTLIEPHARGCKLTEAGTVLLRLVGPNVFDLDSLRRRFDEELQQIDVRITVAAPPRLLAEDLPPCLPAYVAAHPQVRLTLSDMRTYEIEEAVESGRADLGFTTNLVQNSSLLTIEPWYELDVLLIVAKKHPLAKRRTPTPADLRKYPLLNSRQTLADPAVHAAIERAGLFDIGPRRVEGRNAYMLHRLVEAGLGPALVIGKAERLAERLHVRSMSREFGRSRIHLVRRRGVQHHPAVQALADAVREAMND